MHCHRSQPPGPLTSDALLDPKDLVAIVILADIGLADRNHLVPDVEEDPSVRVRNHCHQLPCSTPDAVAPYTPLRSLNENAFPVHLTTVCPFWSLTWKSSCVSGTEPCPECGSPHTGEGEGSLLEDERGRLLSDVVWVDAQGWVDRVKLSGCAGGEEAHGGV